MIDHQNDHGDDKAVDVQTSHAGLAKRVEQETADDCANDAEDDIRMSPSPDDEVELTEPS